MSSLPIDRAPQFRRGVSIGELRLKLPAMIDVAAASQRNVIVRPHGAGVAFIQLDDLKADKLAALAPAVFLILETSPEIFQAWAALTGNEDNLRGGCAKARLFGLTALEANWRPAQG
jgi:hypothetical protein